MALKTEVVESRHGGVSAYAIRKAARALRRGGLVVFPTETVFGIAVDPRRKMAVRRLFSLKKRASAKRMTLQVPDVASAKRMVCCDEVFDRLARAFWPGPLTIVAKKRSGRGTVGIRVPGHGLALRILKAFQAPLAVTSVNVSGNVPLRLKAELLEFLGGKVEMVFWQTLRAKTPSTVVDLTGGYPVILREGPVSLREIERAAGKKK